MSLDQSQGQPPPYSLPVPPRHYSHLLFLSPSLKGGVKEEGPGQLGCRPGCNWKLCSFLALQRLRIPHKRKQFRKLSYSSWSNLGLGPLCASLLSPQATCLILRSLCHGVYFNTFCRKLRHKAWQ